MSYLLAYTVSTVKSTFIYKLQWEQGTTINLLSCLVNVLSVYLPLYLYITYLSLSLGEQKSWDKISLNYPE